jgi:hypothetical protein
MVFHVYVDGVTGTAPDAAHELSEVMSARYGLPAAELRARLSRGRFRVKANVDHVTAEAYARALEAIGALVRIEPAQATPETSAGPNPASRPAPSSLPPQLGARPAPLSLPPQPASRPAPSSLPPQLGARPAPSSLPPQLGARPAPSSLPPRPEMRTPAGSVLPAWEPEPESSLELALQLPSPLPLPPHQSPSPSLPPGEFDLEPGAEPATQLGALERGGLLALASLDDDAPSVAVPGFAVPGFAAPMEAMPASIGPRTARPVARAARPKDEPVDLFAPPDAAPDLVVELADDEIAHRARKRVTAPPVAAPEPVRQSTPAPPVVPAAHRSTPALDARPVGAAGSTASGPAGPARLLTPTLGPLPRPARAPGEPLPEAPPEASWLTGPRQLLASPRGRFAAGALLAIVLGFIPADIVASLRERSALRAIDARVAEVQAAVDSQDSYDALDAFRADQIAAKRSKRRMIGLSSMLIWGAASGALGYVWFRRIRWERFDRGS